MRLKKVNVNRLHSVMMRVTQTKRLYRVELSIEICSEREPQTATFYLVLSLPISLNAIRERTSVGANVLNLLVFRFLNDWFGSSSHTRRSFTVNDRNNSNNSLSQ